MLSSVQKWISPMLMAVVPTISAVQLRIVRGRVRILDPRLVRRYLDTSDKASTSGLRNHAEKCWGADTVKEAAKAADVNAVRKALAGTEMRNGSIALEFERTGKGKLTFSHRQHTKKQTW